MKKNKKTNVKKSLKDINAKTGPKYVTEASKDIEGIYKSEKLKIDNALGKLEKERLKGYIELIDKRKKEILFRKGKFDELKNNIIKNATNVKRQINKLKNQKIKEKFHFDKLYKLNEHLKSMEEQVKDIDVSRKTLITKEKVLLDEIKDFFTQNKEEIEYHGLKTVAQIETVLDKKTRILAEASHALGEDRSALFADKRLLESITDKQLRLIYKINNRLKELNTSHIKLLKEKQELKTEEFEFRQMLDKINEEKTDLITQLKNIKTIK
ncbi:hypothetical protein IH824_09145 [candidate division KSB1 bacterium]|nr:hypothetical protein [candidate division KSB1 bacterium]